MEPVDERLCRDVARGAHSVRYYFYLQPNFITQHERRIHHHRRPCPYFVTFTIVDWVDVFSRKNYRDHFIEALNFYVDNRGLRVIEYVMMTNHVHLILQQPDGKLAKTVQDLKKYTARGIIQLVQDEPESRRDWILHRFEYNSKHTHNTRQHQVWVHDSHAVELWSRKFFEQKAQYIIQNPVVAGWVDKPEDWRYSSAADRLSHAPLVKLFVME